MRIIIIATITFAIAFSSFCAETTDKSKNGFTAAEKEEIQGLRRTSQTFRAVAGKARPAVVHIRCIQPSKPLTLIKKDSSNPQEKGGKAKISVGSGVIVDPKGFILTSYHVVLFAEQIQIFLADRREYEAELISFDPISDLAVLHIDAENLPTVVLGDSDKAEVGDWVLAIGSPFGLQQTVTAGIISATGRDFSSGEDNPYIGFQNFIQTDAAIHAGSSGGPLLDLDGEVIGITHKKLGIQVKNRIIGEFAGISFATPINFAKNVLESMKQGRGAQRAYLVGVGLRDVDSAIAAAANLDRIYGAQVQFVKRNSSAEKAKLKTGDIILAFGETEIRNKVHLRGLIACAPLDKEIKLTILRDGRQREFRFKLGPGEIIVEDKVFGLALANLTRSLAAVYNIEGAEGALIYSVNQRGLGREIGLKPGMVIVSINGMPIPDITAYRNAAILYSNSDLILLAVKYQGSIRLFRLRWNSASEATAAEAGKTADNLDN